jgi:hypothetical protein
VAIVAGLERLDQYMVRCPLSLARMTLVTDEGPVIYRAEKAECRRFPHAPPKRGTRPDGDTPRELQLVLDPEFL